jgi:hypothetical protein
VIDIQCCSLVFWRGPGWAAPSAATGPVSHDTLTLLG